MARLCRLLGERLDRSTEAGRRVLDWPGEADACSDALPLRLTGGLHALVRRGGAPGLAACYPPNPLPDEESLWAALRPVLAEAGAAAVARRRAADQRGRPLGGADERPAGRRRPLSAADGDCSSSAPAPGSTCCSTATATISAECAAGDPALPASAQARMEGSAAARRTGRGGPAARSRSQSARRAARRRPAARLCLARPGAAAGPARSGAGASPPGIRRRSSGRRGGLARGEARPSRRRRE